MRSVFAGLWLCLLLAGCKSTENLRPAIKDADNHNYTDISIGAQHWLKENLQARHYPDGTEIPDVAAYMDDAANEKVYGLLYTWQAAVKDTIVVAARGGCPSGYHVPTLVEWQTLVDFLGGENIAGGKMKESGTLHWTNPNTEATNSSGFTALGAGIYNLAIDQYFALGDWGLFWSGTKAPDVSNAYNILLFNNDPGVSIVDNHKRNKFSVRCVGD